MSQERFVKSMTPALIRFIQDLKSVLRIVEDPEIDDLSRISLAGSLLQVFSSSGVIPGVRGVLRHLGDVLLIRLVLQQVRERSPDAFARHAAQSPEMLESLSEELSAMRAYLQERVTVLEKAVQGLPRLSHQGHKAQACVQDVESSTWLYDAVHGALVDEIDFDEEDVVRELRHVDQILASLASKVRR